jgi:hypothetical protein
LERQKDRAIKEREKDRSTKAHACTEDYLDLYG